MKSILELVDALRSGHTLVHRNKIDTLSLDKNGQLPSHAVLNHELWSIKPSKPHWSTKVPKGGVLCRNNATSEMFISNGGLSINLYEDVELVDITCLLKLIANYGEVTYE